MPLSVFPESWATSTTASRGTPEATRYLLGIGADPSAPYLDRKTPLHTACFFGSSEVAELLIRAGADLTAASGTGDLPVHAMLHPQQTVEFIANMLKLSIDYPEVTAGRERIRRMIEGADIARSEATPHARAGDEALGAARSVPRSSSTSG